MNFYNGEIGDFVRLKIGLCFISLDGQQVGRVLKINYETDEVDYEYADVKYMELRAFYGLKQKQKGGLLSYTIRPISEESFMSAINDGLRIIDLIKSRKFNEQIGA
jgi:hypothetical protein